MFIVSETRLWRFLDTRLPQHDLTESCSHLGITGNPVRVDNRTTGPTPVQQAPVMVGANRDEGQKPVALPVRVSIFVQTVGTILKPEAVTGVSTPADPQEPRWRLHGSQFLLGGASIAHIPPDYVVSGRLLSGEHKPLREFPLAQNRQSKHQPQNNASNINALTFYHIIRWSLELSTTRASTA